MAAAKKVVKQSVADHMCARLGVRVNVDVLRLVTGLLTKSDHVVMTLDFEGAGLDAHITFTSCDADGKRALGSLELEVNAVRVE